MCADARWELNDASALGLIVPRSRPGLVFITGGLLAERVNDEYATAAWNAPIHSRERGYPREIPRRPVLRESPQFSSEYKAWPTG